MRNFAKPRIAVWLAACFIAGPAIAADALADPMRPDTLRPAISAAAPDYRVNAVIVSDERRVAIVNGKRVGIGDTVNRATVVAINKAEVVIEVNGDKQTLQVNSGAGR